MGVSKLNIAAISLLATLTLSFEVEAVNYDITKFGGKPNGDITQALSSVWKTACASPTPSKIWIPSGSYVLCQICLAGPCKAPIEVQVDGILKAPVNTNQFKGEGNWVTIERLDHFTLSGKGTLDGQGSAAWKTNNCNKNQNCKILPISMKVNFLCNSVIRGITLLNSKNFHVSVLEGRNLTFDHITITAPGNSVNTDGIHIGRSNGVKVVDTNIKTGDDCISIGDGSKNIDIMRVTCGPGHGISIGSLGKYHDETPVAGIRVTNCTLTNTENGVRIKTWPASYPNTASDMHFHDIVVNNVLNPILIDQVYCPWNQCNAKIPSKVKLSNISFKNVRGTSNSPVAVKLACSSGFPCQNVELSNINIIGKNGPVKSECCNVKPKFTGKLNPPIKC